MKWLVYLLALANGAYFAWYTYLQPPEPRASRQPAQETAEVGRGGLVLLSELPEEQRLALKTPEPSPAEPPVTDEPGQAAPMRRCYRVEGLETPAAAERIAASLRASGAEVLATGSERHRQQSYWVMVPRYASRAATEPVVARLRAAGITDYYVIPAGENRNAISLGVFTTREAAQRRFERIMGLGLKLSGRLRIEEIGLPARRYWVNYARVGGGEPEPVAGGDASESAPAEISCP